MSTANLKLCSWYPGILTNDGLPKPNAPQLAKHILESYAQGILPVQGAVIPKVAHFKTGKLMPISFLIVNTKNKFIWHSASTQLELLKVLCHYSQSVMPLQSSSAQTNRHHQKTSQPEYASTIVTIHPLQHHNSTVCPFQDHVETNPHYKTTELHSIKDLKSMFPDSFETLSGMPSEYSITVDSNILTIQHRRYIVPIEATQEIGTQLKEMTVQYIITPQVEPNPWWFHFHIPSRKMGL